ncbi:MAG: hypothetical protein RBR02_09835 [Desulfuromonadaceae bacterium]|nr:hypothetical protein [Desulfuromonadaceae bacterium]
MSELASASLAQMASFVSNNAALWAIPIGVCAVGLVLSVVINALRNKG